MNSPRYAGAPPSLVVGGVCLLANFSTCREVGKLAGQGGGGTAGARRGKRTRRARAVGGVDGMRGGERGDQVAGAGARFGGLPRGKEKGTGLGRLAALRRARRKRWRSGGMRCERWRGAAGGWWVVVCANFSTFRLSDLSICWEVGKLES